MEPGKCVEEALGVTARELAERALRAACRALEALSSGPSEAWRRAASLLREVLEGGRLLVVGGLLAVGGEPLPALYVEEDGVIAVSPHALEDPEYAAEAIAVEALRAVGADAGGPPEPRGPVEGAAESLAAAGCVADLAEAGPESPLAALQVAGSCG